VTAVEAICAEPSARTPLDGWLRLAALPVAAALAIYVAIILWAGIDDVARAFARIGAPVALACLACACANFALRFARWQMYMHRLGHRIRWGSSLRIYLAGFALTVSPGKLGETIRAPFLKRLGVPYPDSLSAFLNERLSDLGALVLMSLIGVAAYPRFGWIAFGVGVAIAAMLGLIALEGRMAPSVMSQGSILGRATGELRRILQAARACHGLGTSLAALGLGLAAWTAEAAVLGLIAPRFGLSLSIPFALFVFSVAILAGAVSFVPAGIGGTEAVIALLLVGQGLSPVDAVAAALVMRLTTLWFAVLVGAVALQCELLAGRRAVARP
jgi:uncharacterized protein (TIRG00374 family)